MSRRNQCLWWIFKFSYRLIESWFPYENDQFFCLNTLLVHFNWNNLLCTLWNDEEWNKEWKLVTQILFIHVHKPCSHKVDFMSLTLNYHNNSTWLHKILITQTKMSGPTDKEVPLYSLFHQCKILLCCFISWIV